MKPSGRRISIRGTVQGVGFRPWIFRLAHEVGVGGSVRNDPEGVTIDAYGPEAAVAAFLDRLAHGAPPAAEIRSLDASPLAGSIDSEAPDPSRMTDFRIEPSTAGSERHVSIPPDLATCHDCLSEVADPQDRRYLYPFTNCTNCGPRFTIVTDMPYDRPATTMAGFTMCRRCRAEYDDPLDRRFHAQPNACPECGPRLELLDPSSHRTARDGEALIAAAMAVRRHQIVAVKGLGGFQLLVLATSAAAVERLRRLKHRWEKPLAVMVRSRSAARRLCHLTDEEAALLASPAAPIVLLPRRPGLGVTPAVAPRNPRLGLMLPPTPLHHLLVYLIQDPVVATSGNLSDEPIAIDDAEALERLGGIADMFLVHDRPIARHADDSVMVSVRGLPQPLRRARGYAPRPIVVPYRLPTLLAVGGHMKNTVALGREREVVMSQHIGDMETPQAREAFRRVVADLLTMLDAHPEAIVHDLHPDYPTHLWAERAVANARADGALARLAGLPLVGVQHHHAHLAACLLDAAGPDAESSEGLLPRHPPLGIVWDGTGYGPDGTIWGGEALVGDAASFRRLARLRPFRLPGGEAAVRQPRRTALSVLIETFGIEVLASGDLPPLLDLSDSRRRLIGRMVEGGLGSPLTSSMGRLFDAVASILGLYQRVSFEGQAAVALEYAATPEEQGAYPIELHETSARERAASPWAPEVEIDWRPTIAALVDEMRGRVRREVLARRFHDTLVGAVLALARRAGSSGPGRPRVALTGGCFQNVLLTTLAADLLEEHGFEVLLHRQVPANDGGLALGQIAVAAARTASPGRSDAPPQKPAPEEVPPCV
ncbi:MAG: carbamoyltransferase HypF [Thermoanaerobaculia bacterium]|nr:carbamoyltransferase HypF [Thermoanaerobaculia bacterium]